MNLRNEHGHRVVVTGVGTVNPIGLNVKEFWPNLLAGTLGWTYHSIRCQRLAPCRWQPR